MFFLTFHIYLFTRLLWFLRYAPEELRSKEEREELRSKNSKNINPSALIQITGVTSDSKGQRQAPDFNAFHKMHLQFVTITQGPLLNATLTCEKGKLVNIKQGSAMKGLPHKTHTFVKYGRHDFVTVKVMDHLKKPVAKDLVIWLDNKGDCQNRKASIQPFGLLQCLNYSEEDQRAAIELLLKTPVQGIPKPSVTETTRNRN
jgi:hypothetical protein